MGTMKGAINKLKRTTAEFIQEMKDIEMKARHEYHNSMAAAYNADTYVLRQMNMHMAEIIREQNETICQLMQNMMDMQVKLTNLEMKVAKMSNRQMDEITTTTTTVTVTTETKKQYKEPSYRTEGGRIRWFAEDWTPVDIAFNEFDIARSADPEFDVSDQEEAKKRWSTLVLQCKNLTGMSYGRLAKVYKKERGLE